MPSLLPPLLLCYLLLTVPPPPAISPLSLHDALPIFRAEELTARLHERVPAVRALRFTLGGLEPAEPPAAPSQRRRSVAPRSEEHTSELQSHSDLVCRLLLEKKKTIRLRWLTQNAQTQ